MIMRSKGKIAEGLYAIGMPELPAFLMTDEQPALFDAGMTFMGPRYAGHLKAHLGDEKSLRFNLLTHSHFDHCGATPYLARQIGGLQVGAHPLAAETFRKPNAVALIQSLSRDYEEDHRGMIGGEDVSFDALAVQIPLTEGTDIDLGRDRHVRVIATPGHTRDSVSFYIPGLKALIPGEAVGVFDRNMTIHPEFLSSFGDYLDSLEKLASLDLDILMMSHYFTLTGDDARGYVARSIERTKAFRARIEEDLHELNGEREAVVQRIFREDYRDTGAILQDERPYLINLRAKVKAVAEKR